MIRWIPDAAIAPILAQKRMLFDNAAINTLLADPVDNMAQRRAYSIR
jgi:hypothetical protein